MANRKRHGRRIVSEICRSEWWYGWRDDEDALDRALNGDAALKGLGRQPLLDPDADPDQNPGADQLQKA
jgi:hypothetical protein